MTIGNLVTRASDMNPRSRLQLCVEEDGDMIVTIIDNDRQGPQGQTRIASAEFCTPIMGGGKSPRTLAALRQLAHAMALDQQEAPQDTTMKGEWFLKHPPTEVPTPKVEKLLQTVCELYYSLSNWMEIAEDEDKREYDEKAIKRAKKAYRAITGRELHMDAKPA